MIPTELVAALALASPRAPAELWPKLAFEQGSWSAAIVAVVNERRWADWHTVSSKSKQTAFVGTVVGTSNTTTTIFVNPSLVPPPPLLLILRQ